MSIRLLQLKMDPFLTKFTYIDYSYFTKKNNYKK